MLKTSTCFEYSRILRPGLKHCAAAFALASCIGVLSSLSHAAAGHPAVQKSDTKPSALFTQTFQGARFPIAGITLLSTRADDLLARHSKCQAVTEFNGLGRIVCSQAKFPGGIAGTVLFSYLPSNHLLSGIEIYFPSNERNKSDALYNKLKKAIQSNSDTYEEIFVKGVDSPYLQLSQGRATDSGTWIRLSVIQPQKLDEFERYVKADLTQIAFGDLTVGKTQTREMADILQKQNNVMCTPAQFNTDFEQEYVGACFSFPFEAHYSLSFDPITGVLTSAVLSPQGNATQTLVDEALKGRFNNAETCRNIATEAKVNPTGNINELDYSKRLQVINNRQGTVYAGTCKVPHVFQYENHYVFNLELVTDKTMELSFETRKRVNAEQSRRFQVREDRRKMLTDFFY